VGLAQLAERSGCDAVLAGEVAEPEVFSLLGMIAARTKLDPHRQRDRRMLRPATITGLAVARNLRRGPPLMSGIVRVGS
jgi:hypothetical protein